MVRNEKYEEVKERALALAEDRLVDLLSPMPKKGKYRNPLEMLLTRLPGKSLWTMMSSRTVCEEPGLSVKSHGNVSPGVN